MNIDKCEILNTSKTIAVVGYSGKEGRISRSIAHLLKDWGYQVVGVNPMLDNDDVIPVYKSLKDIPFSIDIVNVFRRPEQIGDIIPDVLEIKPKVLWLQLGIRNDEAVQPAIDSGIITVQDRCIKIEYYNCTG